MMDLLQIERVKQQLYRWRLDAWIDPIVKSVSQSIDQRQTGNWEALLGEVAQLSEDVAEIRVENGVVIAQAKQLASEPLDDELESLRERLRRIGPWEKGPWNLLGVSIDAQWRSDLKWDRIDGAVDWRGKVVMDLGCGNGYYAWRMLDAGAGIVMGVDPTASSVCQAAAAARIADQPNTPMILPIRDSDLPLDVSRGIGPGGAFDIVTSMGVLYHHVSPIEHLRRVASLLDRNGTAIIETLIVPDQMSALTPIGRYAGMANVWVIPSIEMLSTWLRTGGFERDRGAR